LITGDGSAAPIEELSTRLIVSLPRDDHSGKETLLPDGGALCAVLCVCADGVAEMQQKIAPRLFSEI
jgi:hypothetical protein